MLDTIETDLKYCLYARKSSEQDERQAMSIDSQLKEMAELAHREGLQIVQTKQESHSAKMSGQRPVFMEMLQEIRDDKYNGILTWAPDRLSRNAGDLGSLVDLMDAKKLAHIRTHSQQFSNNPNEKFLLMILCSQAKLENDNRAINVKRGIRAKCEMGWRPCMPPLGYFTRAATGRERDVILDEKRAPYIRQMFEMCADGKSGRHIRRWLEESGVTTRKGKHISLSMIYRMLATHYYYGEFEYPKGSGKWYKGHHEPLVTKELFTRVQEQLKTPLKPKWGAKDFPYKRFLKCYSCGANVVGEEKIRNYKNGNTSKFVYYHCSRQVDPNCKEPFVRDYDIAEELVKMCGELITDKTKLEPGLKDAIDKYSKMMRSTFQTTKVDMVAGYIKYVLYQGSTFEKTRLIRNLDIKLALHDKKLVKAESNQRLEV